MNSPTARALADLKKMGFTAQVVERWNAFAKRRVDFFGVIDIIAVRDGIGILAVQATSGDHHSHRREKALAEPKLLTWLECGGRFEIWSYAKQGARGKRKNWTLRREEVKPVLYDRRTVGLAFYPPIEIPNPIPPARQHGEAGAERGGRV